MSRLEHRYTDLDRSGRTSAEAVFWATAEAEDRRRRLRRRVRRALPVTAVPVALAVAVLGWQPSQAALGLISGSSSAAGSALVSDTMVRTVGKGWGTADLGGGYRVSSGEHTSVSPGKARLELPDPGRAQTAMLAETDAKNVDGTMTLSLPAIPTAGTGVYVAMAIRAEGSQRAYRARVRVVPGGGVRLSFSRVRDGKEKLVGGETELPVRLVADQRLTLRAKVTGTSPVTLTSRAWVTGAAAPDAWQHSLTDGADGRVQGSGRLGVWTYLSAAAGAPSAVDITALKVDEAEGGTAPKPPAPTPTGPAEPTTPADPKPPTTPPPGPGSEDPPGGTDRKATQAGSAPVGSTGYPVPPGAIVVSPGGQDSASGSIGAPVRTVAKAITLAPAGGTVVLRGGTYHESVTVPATKRLTIQAHPKEAVWFDGSSLVQGWTADGGGWRHDGWTAKFDSSPSYTRGAPASPDQDFQFVDPKFPMAAHPEQVWIGDTPQRQVGSRGELKSGTFFADPGNRRLYLGSDPGGRPVRASTLSDAITIRAAGTVLRGIGARRYATSLPDLGTIKVVAGDVTVQNVTITDSATTGLTVLANRVRVHKVTALRSGMLGMHANYADDLRMESVRSENNNTEHFRSAPVSGGVKITRSRRVAVLDSVSSNNLGKGLWFDESVYDVKVTGNDVQNNASHGIVLELCAKGVVADNVLRRNGGDGIRINDTGNVQIWNNLLAGNGRTINLIQDRRRASNLSQAGHDPRQKLPDPTVTWLLGQITVSNNILADPGAGGNCVLCVEDYSHERTAAQMQITSNGNAYRRPAPTAPRWLVIWSRGAGDPAVFTTLDAFKAASGQEPHGVTMGADAARSHPLVLTEAARPLPAPIAALIGRPAGARHMGAWGA